MGGVRIEYADDCFARMLHTLKRVIKIPILFMHSLASSYLPGTRAFTDLDTFFP